MEVVGGDLLVSIPGVGTVLLDGKDVLEFATRKGQLLDDSEEDQDVDSLIDSEGE
ncbi:hypothetical protein SAMN05443244_0401 [Terriglobus roseus]|uniref:Uncharacterized protein n=1 Tax=Terriglobus roseus TaxID=392734 RepID=A0A1H4J6C4_9BACT|nr:hypothetical protein SAMN05443244_0401 [Terriglobus roseus]